MAVTVTLVGNATADAELRTTQGGDILSTFTLAVNERIKDGNEWKDGDPSYYRVTAWRGLGEAVAEQVKKGSRLIVTGKFKPRQYETKEGEKRTSLDVSADQVGLAMRPVRANNGQQQPQQDEWASNDAPPF